MNYELASELKEAGFPPGSYRLGRSYVLRGGEHWCLADERDDLAYERDNAVFIPTLSELIEACGDNFSSLELQGGNWMAVGITDEGIVKIKWFSTPDEAVARLWRALNKKV